MQILLDERRVMVSFGSASVFTDESIDRSDLDAPWADESNGLCGAGIPGVLELQVGTHTGWVPFLIELHEFEPALPSHWEDVVEVSFSTACDEAYMMGLGGDSEYRFALSHGEYRVRYCARGFDEAHHSDEAEDSYLLQFWPAPPAPARILVQTSVEAAYWHRARRTLTLQEQEDDDRREAAEREERARARWGDRVPNTRLRATLDHGSRGLAPGGAGGRRVLGPRLRTRRIPARLRRPARGLSRAVSTATDGRDSDQPCPHAVHQLRASVAATARRNDRSAAPQ